MPSWILTVLGFVVRHYKWLSIGALSVFVLAFGINLYNNIREGAVKDILIKQQEQVIKNQQALIAFKDAQVKIANEVSEKLQSENIVLESKYNRIVIDTLGADVNDQAPQSLKNLIRQLKEETGR